MDKQILIELVPSKSGLNFFYAIRNRFWVYFYPHPIILQFLIFHTYYLSDFEIQAVANYLCVRNCFKDLQIYQWKMERNEQDFVWLPASVSPVTYILIGKLMLLLKERMFWKTWCHLKTHHRKHRLLSAAGLRWLTFPEVGALGRGVSGYCPPGRPEVGSQDKSQNEHERSVATYRVTNPEESREASLLPGSVTCE